MNWHRRSPLCSLPAYWRQEKHLTTRGMYAAIVLVTLVIFAKFFVPGLRPVFFRQFHLTSPSFASWVPLQAVPSMYNYSNEVWCCFDQSPGETFAAAQLLPSGATHRWVNHYPLRLVSFGKDRKSFFAYAARPSLKARTMYLRSRYRGRELFTQYRLVAQEGVLHLQPVSSKEGAYE